MLLKKRFIIFYEKFIRLQGEPKAISAGFAIGVFVGVTPTIPFHTAILVMICLLFRKHITAAYLGSWVVSNPLTIPMFYFLQYELGRILLGMQNCHLTPTDYSLGAIATLGWEILLPLLTGGFIMAPFFAVPAYFITYRLLMAKRDKERR